MEPVKASLLALLIALIFGAVLFGWGVGYGQKLAEERPACWWQPEGEGYVTDSGLQARNAVFVCEGDR